MNQLQKQLIRNLANDRMTPDNFVREFGAGEIRDEISLALLETASKERNSAAVESGLAVGFKLGLSSKYKVILVRLFEADWHHSHEDIIFALDKLRDPSLVDVFYKATQEIPAYLTFDKNRALAVKAIWGLGHIGTDLAHKKLQELSRSENSRVAATALEQLRRIDRIAAGQVG